VYNLSGVFLVVIKKKLYALRKYLFIGGGGFFGAVARVLLKKLMLVYPLSHFPYVTLFINISGSFFLALFITLALDLWELDSDIRLGVATGFFGAYTTFSAFCKETVDLSIQGAYTFALFYMVNSVVLGLLATYCGILIARKIILIVTKEEIDETL